MRLTGNLCTIECSLCRGEHDREYILALDSSHFIYRAHFPGNPVTPGACIIQLCKELAEEYLGESLMIKSVINAKFLSILNPVETPRVQFLLSGVTPVEEGYKCTVLVYNALSPFAKISLRLQRVNARR